MTAVPFASRVAPHRADSYNGGGGGGLAAMLVPTGLSPGGYVWLYFAVTVAATASGVGRALAFVTAALQSARRLHDAMFAR